MTKRLFYIAMAVSAMLYFGSCKKITTDKVSKVVNVSYPSIKLKGDSVASISVGGSYADPGATLTDDISHKTTDINATSGSIDANTPGLYFLVYTAANANGFQTTVTRPIAVTNVSASTDLSGTYVRTANGVEVHVKKVATGLYYVDNVGGVPPPSPAVLPVYMAQLNDSTIVIPEQPVPNGYGTLSVEGGKLKMSSSDTTLSYIVVNPGFGTARRTFSKQ